MKLFAVIAAAFTLLCAAGPPVYGQSENVPGAVIGRSLSGRPIQILMVGLPGEEPVRTRPRLLVVAGLDPDHRIGMEVALRLPARLRALAVDDEALAGLLSRFAVEVIQTVNPDGVESLLRGPAREFARNLRPVDEDRDGRKDEDGPDDLNGDGMITLMRVRDPRGTHRVSDEDPRLLVAAEPRRGERGEWRVYTEGLDDDGDGEIAEDPPGGVGLDRNFAHSWRRHDPTAGTSAPSEPETRALIDHVLTTPQIACVLVYGRHDNLTSVPGENKAGPREVPNGPLKDDHHCFRHVSERFRDIAQVESGPGDAMDGAFHQWAYYQHGVPAFSTPLLYPALPEVTLLLPSGEAPRSDDARWLAYSDAAHEGRGFLPWKSFEHPSLGQVEIGGFVPHLRQSAPSGVLERLVEQQARFVAALLGAMPRPVWTRGEAKLLSEGVYEIRAVLSSEGVFPLVTAMGRTARSTVPVRVVIEAPGELLLGKSELPLPRLAGADRVRELRWVLRGAPGQAVRLRAVTEKGGAADVRIDLE